MRLNEMTLINFKKFKEINVHFGDITELVGSNEAGKTSIYDGFLDCLFGCDSLGQSDFERRHNYETEAIVEEVVTLDGVEYRKEYHPKSPQKRCWINGKSLAVRKYEAEVAKIIDKEQFRLLSDVTYIFGLTQDKRREVLLSLTDPATLGEPEGFHDLVNSLEGRTLAEEEKLLRDEKTRLEKARDSAGYRIDELKRELPDQDLDHTEVQAQKKTLQVELKDLKAGLAKIQSKQALRDKAQTKITELRGQLAEREGELKTDTRRVQKYIDERHKLMTTAGPDLHELSDKMHKILIELEQDKETVPRLQDRLQECRIDWQEINATPPNMETYSTGCPTCGQPLPDDQIEAAKQKAQDRYRDALNRHQARLTEINDRGTELMDQITHVNAKIEKLEAELLKLEGDKVAAEAQAEREAAQRHARIAELDKLIEADEKVQPEDDPVWKGLKARMEEIDLGEDVSASIEAITGKMESTQAELDNINEILNTWERQERDHARVNELKKEKADAEAKIREIVSRQAEIRKYGVASAQLLEDAVNGKFEHVTWKLFRDLKTSDEQEPCCIATMMRSGVQVEYKNWSQGMRIAGGIDVIKTISNHYGHVIPLFIDNYESYSLDVLAPGQEVRMIVDKSQPKLKIK